METATRYHVTIKAPEIGEKIKAFNIPGYGELDGRVVTVTEVRGHSIVAKGWWDDRPEDILFFTEWEQPDGEATPTDALIASLNATIDELRESLRIAKSERDDLNTKFARTVEIISERVNTESNNRGWCETFDQIIEDVNGQLPGPYMLAERENEYEVEVTVSGTASTTYTVTVNARSQEDADEMVSSNPEDFFDAADALVSEVRYAGWVNIETEVQ